MHKDALKTLLRGGDEQVAARSGATANITKPFEPGALIELVRSLVSAQEEVKEARAVELVKPVEPPQAARPQETKPVSANVRTEVPPPAAAQAGVSGESDDLLGLETIFKEEPEAESAAAAISDEDIDRIADRVIQRLSTQVIESIAWDILPDITEKIVREELKRIDES